MRARKGRCAYLITIAAICLSACGGGGGGGSRPSPTPPPPPPPPTPPPSTSFDDAEYRASTYAVAANALVAYTRGATGRGAKIAIIDSGIDSASAEFAGRIDPASTGLSDDDGHGTAVARIAAGARNESGTQGVAFESTILSYDTLSCFSGDCFHRLNDVAAATDLSVTNAADVINLSMVGPNSNSTLTAAIGRATQAGVVVVIAAGNSGAADPDGFALQNAQASANGALIIAGAYQGSALISSRAGSGSAWFLAASGGSTSAATPVVSGAAALLAAAFPNLTGQQIVEILFTSADDAGEPGVDPVWGRGILNIGRAFQPSGTTAFAGSTIKLSTSVLTEGSAPMGDADRREGPRAIVLDRYERAYSLDLAKTLRTASPESPLHQAVSSRSTRTISLSGKSLDLSIALTARDLILSGSRTREGERAFDAAMIAVVEPRPATRVAFAKGYDGRGVRNRLLENHTANFAAASEAMGSDGLRGVRVTSAGMLQGIGIGTLVATIESGQALADRRDSRAFSKRRLTFNKRLGAGEFTIGGEWLDESQSVLGATFGDVLAASGSNTTFADLAATLALPSGWRIAGAYRRGWTDVEGGSALLQDSSLTSDAFSLDLSTSGLLAAGDRFGFRIAQPLRIRSGGLRLDLPVGYDYATGATTFGSRSMSLSPIGREIDFEASYARPLFGGQLGINSYIRREAGNIASTRADVGGLISFRRPY